MKYVCTTEVPLNRADCIQLWFDEMQYAEWQEGFRHKKWISGEPNEVGSKSNILIIQGKQKIELEEEILENNLPDFLKGNYVHKHMINTQKVIFTELATGKTQITTEVEYTKFIGILPKIMAFLFSSMFKKQSQKWLDEFKMLAEKNK